MSTQLSEGPLLVNLENGIKTITFNQPQKRNAISNDMAYTLRDIILESKYDDSRVIILTGMGDHFASGADLSPAGSTQDPEDVGTFLRKAYNPTITAMRNMNKIFIAKVRGNCVGAAFSMALACDLTYASHDAKFSQIFTKIGLSSDAGGAFFMQSKLGFKKAFELMALHKMIGASEAEQLGLINKAMPSSELDAYVENMVQSIANGPYLAIQHTKSNLRAAAKGGLEVALEQEADNQSLNFKSKDFMEGISAFLQKRAANFRGE